MAFNSSVRVPTGKASRYLQQLCKHWSHNLDVEFTEQKGAVIFPRNARGADWPDDAILMMHHVDRFAFREAPLTFDWQDAPSS